MALRATADDPISDENGVRGGLNVETRLFLRCYTTWSLLLFFHGVWAIFVCCTFKSYTAAIYEGFFILSQHQMISDV